MSNTVTPDVFIVDGNKQFTSSSSLNKGGNKCRCQAVLLVLLGAVAIAGFVAAIVSWTTERTPSCPDPPPCTTISPPPETKGYYDSQYRTFRFGGAESNTHICSKIGAEILGQYGGSVVDAAIATLLCDGVVNAHSFGIGGGFLATVYDRPKDGDNKVVKAYISREVAPLAATRDMFVNNSQASFKGALSIAVPGEIAGYHALWKEYGRLDWKFLFQPTISLCEEGFKVERALAKVVLKMEEVRTDSELRELFVKSDGTLVQEGDVIRNIKLAGTLRLIAEDPYTFYNGSLAQGIVDDITDRGGIITLEDLANYTVKVKEALNVTILNESLTFYSPPPPSSGAVVCFILKILDGYGFNGNSLQNPETTVQTYHRIVEAFKMAYAKRSSLGDEDFVDVRDLVKNMTSADFAEATRLRINDTYTQPLEYYEPNFELSVQDAVGTEHTNFLAPDGSALALTSTINYHFGSLVRGKRTGIIFNDEMDDFSTPGTSNLYGYPASPSNYIVPGKRPQSSMSPSIAIDNEGKVRFLAGAAGGSQIITATANLAINKLMFGLDPIDTMDKPRLHHQLVPNKVIYEEHLDETLLSGLQARGHIMKQTTSIAAAGFAYNNCSSAARWQDSDRFTDAHCIHMVADGRKGGAPDGF